MSRGLSRRSDRVVRGASVLVRGDRGRELGRARGRRCGRGAGRRSAFSMVRAVRNPRVRFSPHLDRAVAISHVGDHREHREELFWGPTPGRHVSPSRGRRDAVAVVGFERRVLTAQDQIPLARAIQASCFIPGPYSRMVPIDRRLTFDGAWLGRVPIREVHQLGARKVIACVSDACGRLLRGALWATETPDPTDLDYRVLSPVTPLPIGSFHFHPEETLASFEIGTASAKAFADRNREWLSAPTAGSGTNSEFPIQNS